MLNPYSLYGKFANVLKPTPGSIGRVFIMCASDSALIKQYQTQFPSNRDGGYGVSASPSIHSTWASVITQLGTNRGDVICIDPSFATAPTVAERASLESAGVVTYVAGQTRLDGVIHVYRATDTLPQTTTEDIFTVHGRIKLLNIIGTVTTIIQTQTNNVKLISDPDSTTAGVATDLCAQADITGDAVDSILYITGTLANALQESAVGAQLYQATPLIIPKGKIQLYADASSTGSIKWNLEYIPLEPGAWVTPA
jgi:hypothetical protein